MRITALHVKDFKRVEKVDIAPGARSLVIVGGDNAAGKSSVLDAISAAFSGRAVPDVAIREGAEEAEILVELARDPSDPEETPYTVVSVLRKIGPKGTTLEVREAGGTRLGSPQAVLDRLIGSRFLDPLAFARASAKEQRDTLIGCVDLPFDLGELAAERAVLFDRRSDVGREARRWEGEETNIGELPDVPPETSVVDLVRAAATAREKENYRNSGRKDLEWRRSEAAKQAGRVGALDKQLAEARIQLAEQVEGGKAAAAAMAALDAEGDYGTASAEAALAAAETTATERARLVQLHERKGAAHQRAEGARTEYAGLSAEIDGLDAKKAAALEAAAMPLEGLEFDEDKVLYLGVPLKQASGAEQLQVSLAVAGALSPALRDVWIRDGSLLDGGHLDAVAEFAAAKGLRVWIERVGDGDDDAIVIEAGKVRG